MLVLPTNRLASRPHPRLQQGKVNGITPSNNKTNNNKMTSYANLWKASKHYNDRHSYAQPVNWQLNLPATYSPPTSPLMTIITTTRRWTIACNKWCGAYIGWLKRTRQDLNFYLLISIVPSLVCSFCPCFFFFFVFFQVHFLFFFFCLYSLFLTCNSFQFHML